MIPRQQPEGARQRFLLGHAAEFLATILDRPNIPADSIIRKLFAERRYLGSKDRGAIAETVYGVLRRVLRFRFVFDGKYRKDDPWREAGLFVVAYAIERGEAIAPIVINEVVGLGRDGEGLIRSALTAGEEAIAVLDEPHRSAMELGYPVWLTAMVLEETGSDEGRKLLSALSEQAPITLRVNTLCGTREELAERLRAEGVASTAGLYSPEALHLERRMNANSLAEFKSGWFELQDEGSQILSQIVDPHPNWRVFDACAGAGGKTLHLAALMKGRGEVVAHDIHSRRLADIRPRLKRSGLQNVRVLEHEPYLLKREEMEREYNAVVIDAPCTGAGVLRRNPGVRLTLDEAMLERITRQQAGILDQYSSLVAGGGILLYATCSLLRRENEEQVERFLDERKGWDVVDLRTQPLSAALDSTMITPEGYLRTSPHRHGTDAFFGAVLKRRSIV